MPSTSLETFGRNLRAARAFKGINQGTLSAALGLKQSTLSKWERGASFPTVDRLPGIARALGCQVEDLLAGFGEPSTDPPTQPQRPKSAPRATNQETPA